MKVDYWVTFNGIRIDLSKRQVALLAVEARPMEPKELQSIAGSRWTNVVHGLVGKGLFSKFYEKGFRRTKLGTKVWGKVQSKYPKLKATKKGHKNNARNRLSR